MRFIHTADWHLGNSMYHVDRASEADAFLKWLRERIVAEKADALIVSGDVFDTVNPPTDARKKYFSFLSSLKDTPCKSVIITGGNHDSGMLLDAPASVLEDIGGLSVHVVGSMVERTVDDAVFELYGASGEVCGICAALPFMREMDVRRLRPEDDSDVESLFASVYADALAAAEKLRGGRDIPVIATGHLYAADLEGRPVGEGACVTGSENSVVAAENAHDADGLALIDTSDSKDAASSDVDDSSDDGVRPLDIVGKLGRIHSSVFPAGFDYVALGHIHYTTMVARNPKIRYSGSPFVLGFDEAPFSHHVLCVDVSREKQPDVTKLVVPPTLHFMRVSGTASELAAKLAELSANPVWPADSFFIEVCHTPELGLNIHEALESVLKDAPFTVANWKIQKTEGADVSGFYDAGVDGAGQLTEKDIFSMLVEAKTKFAVGSEEHNAVMDELYPLFMEISAGLSTGENGKNGSEGGLQ